jgi:four helix bundle protein
MFGNFRNLALWKSSMNLTTEIYKLTKLFPDHERFGLVSQMQRAAVSIPSNIAEGFGRESTKDLTRFLYTSRGSLMELSTQLEISINLGYISSDSSKPIIDNANEVNKLLNGLIYSLKSQLKGSSKSK